MRVAFATCADLPQGSDDDAATARYVGAEFKVWNDPDVDWHAYDLVVVRSTWDYAASRDEFVAWAYKVGPERLRNHPDVIEFCSDKRYLSSLRVPVVPTIFVRAGDPMPTLRGEVVVKPSISAGARDTGMFTPNGYDKAHELIERITSSGRTAMVQPYIASAGTAGETSVVFINGELSHVLHKKPLLLPDQVAPVSAVSVSAPADAMLDSNLVTVGTADELQRRFATRAHREIADRFGVPLYLRVDFLRGRTGGPVLLELEAVEPCLYLNAEEGASTRFAAALLES
jgi:hypothetical protein